MALAPHDFPPHTVICRPNDTINWTAVTEVRSTHIRAGDRVITYQQFEQSGWWRSFNGVQWFDVDGVKVR